MNGICFLSDCIFFVLQTQMEYKSLLGAPINGPVNRKGKVASAQMLRSNASRLRSTNVDYRALGYVTEVKDQVGFSIIILLFYPKRIT